MDSRWPGYSYGATLSGLIKSPCKQQEYFSAAICPNWESCKLKRFTCNSILHNWKVHVLLEDEEYMMTNANHGVAWGVGLRPTRQMHYQYYSIPLTVINTEILCHLDLSLNATILEWRKTVRTFNNLYTSQELVLLVQQLAYTTGISTGMSTGTAGKSTVTSGWYTNWYTNWYYWYINWYYWYINWYYNCHISWYYWYIDSVVLLVYQLVHQLVYKLVHKPVLLIYLLLTGTQLSGTTGTPTGTLTGTLTGT